MNHLSKDNSAPVNPPEHGGDLRSASEQFNRPIDDWLDLSTGISPDAYPVPEVPSAYFQRLPETCEPAFCAAVNRYYGAEHAVAASGSQRFIECLPRLRPTCRVALPLVGYQEHAYQWQCNGHELLFYNSFDPEDIDRWIAAGEIDVLVVINPCNPTGTTLSPEQLLTWHDQLAERDGWWIVDEAVADTDPALSVAAYSQRPGLVVLRSLGKFFGLAGIRMGFALADTAMARRLSAAVGPWAVSGPSQYIASHALSDMEWQQRNRRCIASNVEWMQDLLRKYVPPSTELFTGASLFVSFILEAHRASALFERLAGQGIWIRRWPLPAMSGDKTLLRFGLISANDDKGRRRLQRALNVD